MAVKLPTSQDQLRHIFRNAEGHVADTTENRLLLLRVANEDEARLESDRYGNDWYVKLLADGRQVWVQVRGQQIVNAGINDVPRSYNPRTGLKKL